MRSLLFVLGVYVGGDPELLTLEACVAIAEAQSRDMVRARADIFLAEVNYARALAAVLPRVDLTVLTRADVNRNRVIEGRTFPLQPCREDPCENPRLAAGTTFSDVRVDQTYVNSWFQAQVGVRQLLFDGGRWWVAIARADDAERQQRALLDAVRNNVRLRVVRTFYGFEQARQAVLTFQAQIDKGQAQVERVRQRQAQGQATVADVANAERNLAQDRLGQARRRFNEARARRSLNLAMGRPAKTPVRIIVPEAVRTATNGVSQRPLPSLEALEKLASSHRPELRLQRARLDVLARDVVIRRADYWPRITVGANYIRTSRQPDRTFDPNPGNNVDLRLDVTLQWNLFRGLGTNALVDAALLNLAKARADHDETERAVFGEVQDAQQNLQLQNQVFELARGALRSASRAVEIARDDFAGGQISAFELRDAEQNYTRASQDAINARLAVEVAREGLRRAVGCPIFPLDASAQF